MSPLRITTDRGDQHVLSLAGLEQRLARGHRLLTVLSDLIQRGNARVELNDGAQATVIWPDDPRQPLVQAVLPLTERRFAPAIMRDYDVSAQLMFELPAHVRCRARSEQEATLVAEEVLRGDRGAPAGFAVEISQDDIEGFITGLEIACDGVPHGFGIKHVHVTGINQRILLEDHRSC